MQRHSNSRHLEERCAKLQVRAQKLADQPLRPLTPLPRDDGVLPRLGPDGIAQLVAEYEAGATTNELVEQFKISKGAVVRLLHEHGVAMRRQSPTDEQAAEAVRLYGTGLSLAAVGSTLGFDAHTIRRVLLQAEVRMRDSHGRER